MSMNQYLKIFTFTVGALVAGFCIGVFSSYSALSERIDSPGEVQVQQFMQAYEALGSPDGVPKTKDATVEGARVLLAMSTVNVGLSFASVDDPQLRDEAVRIVGIIDKSPKFRLGEVGEVWNNAAKARGCIISESSNPQAVSECVRNAMVPPGDPASGSRSTVSL